jgi:outer membrane lipoprotein-sorting protein
MRRSKRWIAVLGLLVALPQLSACTQTSAEATSGAEPAKVEHLGGSEVSRLTLTPKAVQRLGIRTATVREETVAGKKRKVIPYGAVLYDAKGATSVYVSPAANTYVRQPITVDFIEGDRAVLEAGPAAGTAVVSVGAAELYGTETGVGH